ncbi:MAG: GNAT family N-acetyltransferase [Ponticaulis sp.]|nr:GNAT family N-acetyltransferase [Ponticaulis sp.]|tara:strand:- start:28638 stop:29246 length:609 start_codon:yes stop_codon:yes gene_type:complete
MTTFLQKISIHPARIEDIEEIQSVDLAAGTLFDATGLINEGPTGQSPIPTRALKAGCMSGLLSLAAIEETIVGFVLCRKVSPDLYLEQISVQPEFGRRGIGACLTQHTIQQADNLRLRGVVLSTFRDVAWNGPFYRRLGFSELPRQAMKPWMLELETLQAHSMDVSLRCFMRRPGRWDKNWLRLPAANGSESQKPIAIEENS